MGSSVGAPRKRIAPKPPFSPPTAPPNPPHTKYQSSHPVIPIFHLSMPDAENTPGEPLTLEDFRDAEVAGRDRRREPRFASQKAIAIRSCRLVEERGFRPAHLLDCSTKGLGIHTDEPMD